MTGVEVVHVPPSVEVMVHAGVQRDAVDRPLGRLFLLLCERYDLDPALRQVEVIPTKQGPQVYITADGYRHIALASDLLDGITIDSSEGGNGWRAFVTVWRKGCGHGFDGRAGCGFAEGKEDPEAQAITRATRRALRNAFDPIRVEAQYADLMRDSDVDEDADAPQGVRVGGPGLSPQPPGPADNPQPIPVDVVDDARQAAAREAFRRLGDQSRTAFRRRHRIQDIDAPWPSGALHELAGPEPGRGRPVSAYRHAALRPGDLGRPPGISGRRICQGVRYATAYDVQYHGAQPDALIECRAAALVFLPEVDVCASHASLALLAVAEGRRRDWSEVGGWLWSQILVEHPVPEVEPEPEVER